MNIGYLRQYLGTFPDEWEVRIGFAESITHKVVTVDGEPYVILSPSDSAEIRRVIEDMVLEGAIAVYKVMEQDAENYSKPDQWQPLTNNKAKTTYDSD